MVFSTIAENIRSFFGREDELSAHPKDLPDPASEALPRATAAKPEPQKIIDRPLPERPQLPFQPQELREATKKPTPEPVHDIGEEINAFESALELVHKPTPEQTPTPTPQPQTRSPHPTSAPTETRAPTNSFFDEFSQFALREDLDAEGMLENDLVHRMREFHKHLKQGKEYYVYSNDVRAAIERKLSELKMLEREWFHTRNQMDELESGLVQIEAEVETRSQELRTLLKQAKTRSRLEQQVAAGEEFVLQDGRKLRSLLDLRIAIRTMPEDIFHHHVSAIKNDFASWVRHSIKDNAIADDLARLRDKHQIEVFLSKMAG